MPLKHWHILTNNTLNNKSSYGVIIINIEDNEAYHEIVNPTTDTHEPVIPRLFSTSLCMGTIEQVIGTWAAESILDVLHRSEQAHAPAYRRLARFIMG